MAIEANKSSLSDPRRWLLELMQKISFGWIMDLRVENGEPTDDEHLRIVKVSKIGGENGPRPELSTEDFILRGEVIDFFEHLKEIENGTVNRIEIKHGLPFKIEEEIQP